MRTVGAALVAAAFLVGPVLHAQEPKAAARSAFRVPYRLTETKHVLVRAKVNGKGPFNFIVDTGAPALFVSREVGKKVGVEGDGSGWATLDRFELEGGVVLPKMRARIETPFQLDGMNGMGLAGVELHGMIGYTVIAKFKMEVDFTQDKLVLTRLNFDPPEPKGLGGGAPAGLDAMGSVMKLFGVLLGKNVLAEPAPRGLVGVELADQAGAVKVVAVLANGPADKAGLKPGDVVTALEDKPVKDLAGARDALARVAVGESVGFTIQRGGKTETIRVPTGEGL